MWRLLRAEVLYDRLRIGLFLFLCLAAFLTIWLGVKWERNRVPMIMLMVLVLSLSAVYGGEKNRVIQKRDRLHVLLPVSLWHIGMVHLLYSFFVLAIIYFLLFVSVIVARPIVSYRLTMPTLAHLFTLTGFVLIVNALTLLHRDLRVTFTKKYLRVLILVFWFVAFFGALLPFYMITNFLGVFGENTPAQNLLIQLLASPVGFMAAGIILSVLSCVIFNKRRSYVGS